MTKREYLTVTELNSYINNIFLQEELLHTVPVVGEVSGCSYKSGHCYYTLKDSESKINVVFFSCPSNTVPKNGDRILVRGTVDYYIKGGQLNLKAFYMEKFGVGQLYAAFENLKTKLSEDGYFDEKHKKDIPLYPKRVCIVTSTQGAAVQDFITTVRKYNSQIDIIVIDIRVQGESCVSDALTALINADDYGFDIIVLARGGGSFEDLFCFNDERLVKTIYNMKTPIISAIGHETDYTLCDFVADYRAITPTAAAEKVAYNINTMKADIIDYIENISVIINNKYKNTLLRLSKNLSKLENNANIALNKQYSKIKNYLYTAKTYTELKYEHNINIIKSYCDLLDKLSPLKLLNNGYFRILKDNKLVFDTEKIALNEDIIIIGNTEKITAIVIKKETR